MIYVKNGFKGIKNSLSNHFGNNPPHSSINSSCKQYTECPEQCYSRTEDSWNCPADTWDFDYTYDAAGIRFFIKMEREHYGILNSYVFYPLSTLQLKTRSDPSKMLPTFMDNIPNQYYLDAERHMKKDGDRLDKVVTSFKAKLKEVNEKINDLNEVISTRINEVFMEKGIDLDKGKDNAEVKTINYWIRHYIRQCIESDNIYQIANQLPGGLKAVEIFSDGSKQVIQSVNQDISILANLSDWKEFETELEELKASIQNKSATISMAIHNKHYNIRADCCPTYWSLVTRFF